MTNCSLMINEVVKLDGENYNRWKDEVTMVLLMEGSLQIVLGELEKPSEYVWGDDNGPPIGFRTWTRLNETAASTIFFTVDDKCRGLIRGIRSGVEAWNKLKEEFDQKSRARRYDLRRRFAHPTHNPSQSITTYINEILSAHDGLKSVGCPVDDFAVRDTILINLHPSFEDVKVMLMNQEDEPSLSQVEAALVKEEADRPRVVKG